MISAVVPGIAFHARPASTAVAPSRLSWRPRYGVAHQPLSEPRATGPHPARQDTIELGEFNGRGLITVERLAQNTIDATRYGIADEAGDQPQGLIDATGPAAYFATLPIRAIVKAMRASGVPADISDIAGTFGCNLLMYGVLHHMPSTVWLSASAGCI